MDDLTEIIGGTHGHAVTCRECGDVTLIESGFTIPSGKATGEQAGLYRQRHLAKHLVALAAEIEGAAR